MLNFSTSLSGIRAAVQRLNVSASNIANLNTPGYRAQRAELSEAAGGGVQFDGVREDNTLPVLESSNVDLAAESVALLTSEVSARANRNALQAQDAILKQLLERDDPK